MGLFDDISDGDRWTQVKIWGKKMRSFRVGDTVGAPCGSCTPEGLAADGTYSVAIPEDGFIDVVDGIVVRWGSEPGCVPVITAWGLPVDDEEMAAASRPKSAKSHEQEAAAERVLDVLGFGGPRDHVVVADEPDGRP